MGKQIDDLVCCYEEATARHPSLRDIRFEVNERNGYSENSYEYNQRRMAAIKEERRADEDAEKEGIEGYIGSIFEVDQVKFQFNRYGDENDELIFTPDRVAFIHRGTHETYSDRVRISREQLKFAAEHARGFLDGVQHKTLEECGWMPQKGAKMGKGGILTGYTKRVVSSATRERIFYVDINTTINSLYIRAKGRDKAVTRPDFSFKETSAIVDLPAEDVQALLDIFEEAER